jgi:hypothetical protein
MRPIFYRGELAAVVTSTGAFLAPTIEALPRGHPRRRFVAAMCLFGRDVGTGELPDSSSNDDAELYARWLLIPEDEFTRFEGHSNGSLAARFGVPEEQIERMRRDRRDDARATPAMVCEKGGPNLTRRDL